MDSIEEIIVDMEKVVEYIDNNVSFEISRMEIDEILKLEEDYLRNLGIIQKF